MRRCGAYSRTTGRPCRNPPMRYSTRCRMHGGASPQAKRKAAQRRAYAEVVAAFAIAAVGERADETGTPRWVTDRAPASRTR
jgi:hypothetical protein